MFRYLIEPITESVRKFFNNLFLTFTSVNRYDYVKTKEWVETIPSGCESVNVFDSVNVYNCVIVSDGSGVPPWNNDKFHLFPHNYQLMVHKCKHLHSKYPR